MVTYVQFLKYAKEIHGSSNFSCNCYYELVTKIQLNLFIWLMKPWLNKPPNSQGFFQALCHTTVFCVPHWVCKRLKTFSHAEDMKKSARGLQSVVSPPLGQGRALMGDQEAKHREAQHIWALRISYFSSKSVIFC